MKATVVAQNKKYLVEFKSDEQMISFLTNHGHQVEKFDIINEETLPAMEKPVELPKISKPTGWKTLEKSAVSDMTKETGAETKSMKLGGKYNTFKYEPDASLESNTSNKNSEGSIDSPALKGDEPKVSSVEDTNEVKSIKQPKASYKDMEDDSEEDTETEEKEEVSESVKDFLPRGGFIKDDETERKEGIWGGQGTDEQIRKAKLIAKVKHANGDRMGRVTKEDLDNYAYYLEQYQEIFGLDESKNSDKKEHKHEDDDEFEKTHECSWCGEKFPESDMKCEKDMGWLCEHDWKYLESKESDLEEVDPSETGLDETETNEDYQNGFEEGKFAYETGHFISPEDRNDLEGDSESEEFWRGYDDGYESAKEGLDDSEEELEENTDPITRNPYKGDDIVSYAKSSMWRPEDEELEEGFKDGLKKAGKFAKNAVAGAAVAGSLMTANPTTANATNMHPQSSEQVTYNDVVKAGKPITVNGHTFTIQQLQQLQKEQGFDEADMNDIVNGIDPYYDGATRPFADSNETLEDYLRAEDERHGGDISPDGSNSQSDGYLRGFTEDDE